MSGRRRRHRFRSYNRFRLGGNVALRWCVDCGSVEQVATYETRRVRPDGATWTRVYPIPDSFELIETTAYNDADPEWCSAKKWERRRNHRFARRDAR